jgi:hypothetical protein
LRVLDGLVRLVQGKNVRVPTFLYQVRHAATVNARMTSTTTATA